MSARDRPPNLWLEMLDPADFDLLRPHLATAEMVRETVLSKQGDAVACVYFPHEGAVAVTVNLADGLSIEVAMLGRDGIVGAGGALADGATPTHTMVLFPGVASILPVAAFRSIAHASTGGFRRLMVRHEQALLLEAQQSLLCNTIHPVEARLARCLLRACDQCNSQTLPLTQELLARMIGVRRNAVSIVASGLQRAGAIRYSRGQIEITDRQALARTSCDCYRAVKMGRQLLLTSEA